jgi:hypothetical protein
MCRDAVGSMHVILTNEDIWQLDWSFHFAIEMLPYVT